jgi:hypothetical protein
MSSPREAIKTVRDYEKFLRSRGFSGREAKILAKSYRDIESAGTGDQRRALG